MITDEPQPNASELGSAGAENGACSSTDVAGKLDDRFRKLRDSTEHLQKLISQCDLLLIKQRT
jgi:hypothetical protein